MCIHICMYALYARQCIKRGLNEDVLISYMSWWFKQLGPSVAQQTHKHKQGDRIYSIEDVGISVNVTKVTRTLTTIYDGTVLYWYMNFISSGDFDTLYTKFWWLHSQIKQ